MKFILRAIVLGPAACMFYLFCIAFLFPFFALFNWLSDDKQTVAELWRCMSGKDNLGVEMFRWIGSGKP